LQWQQKSDPEKLSVDQPQSVKLQSEDQQLKDPLQEDQRDQLRKKLLSDDVDSSDLQDIMLSQHFMR
jgi:hypothetical protein